MNAPQPRPRGSKDLWLDAAYKMLVTNGIEAVADLFQRHGFSHEEANNRAMTVIYTQIGYISMQVEESRDERLLRVPRYVEVFSGRVPSKDDVARFLARHS